MVVKVDEEIDVDALNEIEEKAKAFTLSDAIRLGSLSTKQAQGWGDGEETACALTAAVVALRGKGLI